MSKINEYPQAVTINNNDLFVIDQESGGDHATKSASVSQIADKATSGVQTQIGSLSQLTTTDKSSLVGAVNEVVSNYNAKEVTYTGNTTAQGFLVSDIDFTTKIRAAYVTDSSTGKYFCILRPSSSYKVVAMVINDNMQPQANQSNYTLHVFYSDK